MAKGYVARLEIANRTAKKNCGARSNKGKGNPAKLENLTWFLQYVDEMTGERGSTKVEAPSKAQAEYILRRRLQGHPYRLTHVRWGPAKGNPAKLEHLAGWEGAQGMSLEDLIGTQGTQIPGLRKARRAVKRGSTKSKKSTQSYRHDTESQRLLGNDAGMAMGMRLRDAGKGSAYIRAYGDGVKEVLAWEEHAMASYNPRKSRKNSRRQRRR